MGTNSDVRRSGGVSLLALAAYGAMVGALGPIMFALSAPPRRIEGAVPPGVPAEMFVFLWTEIAAVIAVALLVSTWAPSGPRP